MKRLIKKRVIKKTIRPVNDLILIRHQNGENNIGGIIIPKGSEEQKLEAFIKAMPEAMKDNSLEFPYEEGDKIIYDIRKRTPITLDPKDEHYLIHAEDVLAVVAEEEIEIEEEVEEPQEETSNADTN